VKKSKDRVGIIREVPTQKMIIVIDHPDQITVIDPPEKIIAVDCSEIIRTVHCQGGNVAKGYHFVDSQRRRVKGGNRSHPWDVPPS
jgi:hypothetical protein